MPELSLIEQSNSRIASTFPNGLVAVFVGATNGIGEYTLKAFAKHVLKSKVYFVGRSAEAGARIKAEYEELAPSSSFEFIQADLSLLKSVRPLCEEIKRKVGHVNVLWLSQGTLDFNTVSSEGLKVAETLQYLSRQMIMEALLPELQAAPGLRRVVTCLSGTKEDTMYGPNFDEPVPSMLKARGHGTTVSTLNLENFADRAPTVSFIHSFPGPVKTGLGRTMHGALMQTLKIVFSVVLLFTAISAEETGERHLWLLTSDYFPSKDGERAGVEFQANSKAAKGSNGERASGCYTTEEKGEPAPAAAEALLKSYRDDGWKERIWEAYQAKIAKVVGSAL